MDFVATVGAVALGRQQFEEFYDRTAAALRAYIKRVAGSETVADDILQESYLRLLSAPRLAAPALKSYLYRIATNLIMDHHRTRSRERLWQEDASRRVEFVESGVELGADLRRLFAQVKPQDRALLWLAYVEQAEHREIAEILGLAQGSVKVLLSRARAKMEAILKENGVGGPR
jgi:RNA polymerase sigma-70 factor (ECF subfamily)